jgi:polar amino acid transport system substrate-binding protein
VTLNAGNCDIGASAMTINDDRKKNIDFSEGYYQSKQSLLVPAGSPIKSIADLDGKNLGVQKATTGKDYAEANAKGANIVTFPSDAEEFQALKAGTVDALLQDLPVNLVHTKDGKYTVVETYDTNEEYGLAIKKGNTQLVKDIDGALDAMHKDGTYDKIYNKYFKVK